MEFKNGLCWLTAMRLFFTAISTRLPSCLLCLDNPPHSPPPTPFPPCSSVSGQKAAAWRREALEHPLNATRYSPLPSRWDLSSNLPQAMASPFSPEPGWGLPHQSLTPQRVLVSPAARPAAGLQREPSVFCWVIVNGFDWPLISGSGLSSLIPYSPNTRSPPPSPPRAFPTSLFTHTPLNPRLLPQSSSCIIHLQPLRQHQGHLSSWGYSSRRPTHTRQMTRRRPNCATPPGVLLS